MPHGRCRAVCCFGTTPDNGVVHYKTTLRLIHHGSKWHCVQRCGDGSASPKRNAPPPPPLKRGTSHGGPTPCKSASRPSRLHQRKHYLRGIKTKALLLLSRGVTKTPLMLVMVGSGVLDNLRLRAGGIMSPYSVSLLFSNFIESLKARGIMSLAFNCPPVTFALQTLTFP